MERKGRHWRKDGRQWEGIKTMGEVLKAVERNLRHREKGGRKWTINNSRGMERCGNGWKAVK